MSRISVCKASATLMALFFAGLMLTSCSFSSERIVTFSGRVITVSDSSQTDSAAVDLADIVGYLVYDKQFDGVFDDTAVFSGSEDGLFDGILQYDIPANITAPRLRKHVRFLFPDLAIDTFLVIDVYRADIDIPVGTNDWSPIIAHIRK